MSLQPHERILPAFDISEEGLRQLEIWLLARIQAGGIKQITSNDGSVTIVDPFGPVVDLSVVNTSKRIVYGRIYNDGEILDAGSGDWSSEQSGYGVGIAITIDPPFTTSFAFTCTPNDNGDDLSSQPALIDGSGLSESGFVMGYQVDLGTVVIYFWDLDGNFAGGKNRCGFDFQAVGT